MAWVTPTNVATGDVLTASRYNADVVANGIANGRGYIALASVTAAQNGIGSTATDITGLSVTFTAEANRRYKVTGFGQFIYASGIPAVGVLRITDGTNTQVQETNMVGSAAVYTTFNLSVVVTPSAGSVTYKLRTNVNSGTMNFYAASTAPAFILVEDLGGTT